MYLESKLQFNSAVFTVGVLFTNKRQHHFGLPESFGDLLKLKQSKAWREK